MTLDPEDIDAVYKALLIPLGSRIYGNGMATREKLSNEATKKHRQNDKVYDVRKAKKFIMEFER